MVNGISVNERNAAFMDALADADISGLSGIYRDYKLLGALMSEAQQDATVKRLQGALQDKLGMMRVLPTPEALGAVPGIDGDGRIRYNNADLIDRYGDALRKTEMWKQGVIELDTRTMLITSIGKQRMGPTQWVEENTRRYQQAFDAAVEEGGQRYAQGRMRFPTDMPEPFQVGLYAHNRAENVVKAWDASIGVPEGAGQLISMNRWAYDPSGSGLYVRPDMLLDLGPNRPNQILRHVVDGKSSLAEAMSSSAQLGRMSNWVGTPSVKAATPQGIWTWPSTTKKGR